MRTSDSSPHSLRRVPVRKILSQDSLGTQETEEEDEKYSGVVCPTCGTTYEEFVGTAGLDARISYSVFDPLISDHIRHLQGSKKHVGKHPAGFQPDPAVIGEAAGPGRGSGEYPGTFKRKRSA